MTHREAFERASQEMYESLNAAGGKDTPLGNIMTDITINGMGEAMLHALRLCGQIGNLSPLAACVANAVEIGWRMRGVAGPTFDGIETPVTAQDVQAAKSDLDILESLFKLEDKRDDVA